MKLTAQPRELLGKKSHRLLREGGLPAIVYGHHAQATPITIDAREFNHVFHRVGRTHLIDLEIDGRMDKVLVKEVQTHPRRHGPIHVDFHQVSLSEKLQVEVPVVVTGESPIVKLGEGDVQVNVHSIKVECLPTEIPESFTVDVTGLAEVGDAIRVSELAPVAGVTVLDDLEEVIVKIAPRRELVIEEAEEAEAAEAVEGEAAEGAEAEAEPEAAEGAAKAAAAGGEEES